jgi:hypothetical protein
MRQHLKRLMIQYPGIFNPLWERIYPLLRTGCGEVPSEFDDNNEAFTAIYSENKWGDKESASGWGSTLSYTRVVRKHLERLLSSLNVMVFLDAPCGDLNWMQKVRLPPETSYLGGDIVPDLIQALNDRHGRDSKYRFAVMDIVRDPIPPADLWLCRDVLFHLSTANALAVLRNFTESAVPFILTTTFDFVKANTDVQPGGFRYINLTLPPFELGRPRLRIPDFVAPAPPRYLGLWSRQEVAKALSRNPALPAN